MKEINILLLLLVQATGAWAMNFWSDGFYFRVLSEEEKTIRLTTSWEFGYPTYYHGDLVIPQEVTYHGVTYTVTAIGQILEDPYQELYITSIHLPNTITTLEEDAFAGLWNLKNLNIPKSVKHIGKNAFSGCKSWECDELDLSILDTVPERVLNGCVNLKCVKLGTGTKHICKEAFSGCTSLTDMDGIENVETMEDKAFENTPFYDAISNAVIEGPIYIGHIMWAYKGNTPEELEVEEGTTQITHNLFQNDPYLKHVTIPGSMKDMGEHSFAGCQELASVTIGEGARTISAYAFHSCKKLKDVTLPSTLEEIGSGAFSGCEGLETLEFPLSLQVINYYAFKDCINLSSELQFGEGLKEIDVGAFENCTHLKGELIIPNSTEIVGDHAFKKCSSLTSLICESNTIGASAFELCWGLTSLTSFAEKIEPSAFSGCRNLRDIRFNNTTELGMDAFKDCVQLESLYLYGAISNQMWDQGKLKGLAFEGCENIHSIYSCASIPGQIYNDTFSSIVMNNANLFIPKGSSVNYFEADVWRRFVHIIEDDTLLNSINDFRDPLKKQNQFVIDLSGRRTRIMTKRGLYILEGKKIVCN